MNGVGGFLNYFLRGGTVFFICAGREGGTGSLCDNGAFVVWCRRLVVALRVTTEWWCGGCVF